MTERPAELAGVGSADLTGETALVTGSTSGIGRETALSLGRLGADVLVHGRDREAGRSVVEGLAALGADAAFEPADFERIDAVRDLAAATREWADGIDVLVNNAGGFFRTARLTELGVERTFQVNHLAPYLLTVDLLPALSPGARIVTTASGAHRGAQSALDAVEDVSEYSGWQAYQRSKLANIQFSFALARRLEAAGRSITANVFHPGAVPGSGFMRFLPGPVSTIASALDKLPFVTSVAEGAATAVYLSASPRVDDVTGRYFVECRPRDPSAAACDRTLQRRLWERSAALLGIDEPLADTAV